MLQVMRKTTKVIFQIMFTINKQSRSKNIIIFQFNRKKKRSIKHSKTHSSQHLQVILYCAPAPPPNKKVSQLSQKLLTWVLVISGDSVLLSCGYISSLMFKTPTETFDSVPLNQNKFWSVVSNSVYLGHFSQTGANS